ncbi:MAG: DUF3732 domain-containing protein, partial [Salinivirgaceae bacterium]|nr:DUF3732 domain-containing protein [Salinivirgaceae bacterium]
DQLTQRQSILVEQLKPLRRDKMKISKEIEILKEAQKEGVSISKWLNSVKRNETLNDKNICPICHTPNAELNEIAYKIYEAEKWIESELEAISNTDYSFDKEIEKYKQEIEILNIEITRLQSEFDINQELINQVIKEKPIEESIFYAQRRVIAEANYLIEKRKQTIANDLALLSDRVDKLNNLVSNNNKNISENYQNAKDEIEAIMNFIVSELYFEHQPPNLKFELNPSNTNDAYKLYQYNNEEKDKMYMSQMGSASNYLACHIGLFVSFLCYFSLRDNSKVPSMLFLDQPSQTYFTSGKKLEEDVDIARVKKIYDTLIEWISYISAKKGFEPQIIVSDHIEHLGKNTEYLKKYFRANWRNGNGFI